jgi:hypothetical protein
VYCAINDVVEEWREVERGGRWRVEALCLFVSLQTRINLKIRDSKLKVAQDSEFGIFQPLANSQSAPVSA